MNEARAAYEEITPWPAWVLALTVLGIGSGAFALAREASRGGAGALATAAAVLPLLVLPILLWVLLGRLRVQVFADRLVMGFGFVPLVRKTLPFADVLDVEAVRYRPLRDFGGWGIRFGFGDRRAWTIRGNQAVCLSLRDGLRFYVGSQKPERLAAAIRSAGWSPPAEGVGAEG